MRKFVMRQSILKMAVLIFMVGNISFGATHRTGPFLSGVLNLNTASMLELQRLPGIGEKKAKAIIEFRKTKSFAKIEDIRKVKGVSEKMFLKMNAYLVVKGETTLQEKEEAASMKKK